MTLIPLKKNRISTDKDLCKIEPMNLTPIIWTEFLIEITVHTTSLHLHYVSMETAIGRSSSQDYCVSIIIL